MVHYLRHEEQENYEPKPVSREGRWYIIWDMKSRKIMNLGLYLGRGGGTLSETWKNEKKKKKKWKNTRKQRKEKRKKREDFFYQ